jgi:hypothetical protein
VGVAFGFGLGAAFGDPFAHLDGVAAALFAGVDEQGAGAFEQDAVAAAQGPVVDADGGGEDVPDGGGPQRPGVAVHAGHPRGGGEEGHVEVHGGVQGVADGAAEEDQGGGDGEAVGGELSRADHGDQDRCEDRCVGDRDDGVAGECPLLCHMVLFGGCAPALRG